MSGHSKALDRCLHHEARRSRRRLTAAERQYVKYEIDRRRREQVAAQQEADRSLFAEVAT